MRAFLSVILLCLWAFGGLAGGDVFGGQGAPEGFMQRLVGEKAEVYALDQENLWRLITMARLCSREADQLLQREGTPRRRLQFLGLEREFSEQEFKGGDIPVPVAESAPRQICRIFQAFLWRRLREELPKDATQARTAAPRFLQVLSAGMANRVAYGGIGMRGYYWPDFRIPRRQFRDRCFPDLEKLLDMPVPSDRPAVLTVYLAHANLLLDILVDANPDFTGFLRQWTLAESQDGLSTIAALSRCLPPGTLRPGETLQGWYERRALELSQERPGQNTAAGIQEQLEEILTVSVLSADARDGILRVHLEQLPWRLNDYKVDTAAVNRIYDRILRLQNTAPLLLRDAVGDYLSAVSAFRHQDYRLFRERLKVARRNLSGGLERQRAAEELLERSEERSQGARALSDWSEILLHYEPWSETSRRWLASPGL